MDSAEYVWKKVFEDIKKVNNGRSETFNRGLIKVIDPNHPVIKTRTEFLEWGPRHEEISPKKPQLIVPMTYESLKTIDEKLIGQDHELANSREKITVFEMNLKELMDTEENIQHVVFSSITSYSLGNTSKSMDCINRLYLTPMEVRWLNLFVNDTMQEEGLKDVVWPVDVHIGLYHPYIFQNWLVRKMKFEERKVMSLKDITRGLIQKAINPKIDPYQRTCPCVHWIQEEDEHDDEN